MPKSFKILIAILITLILVLAGLLAYTLTAKKSDVVAEMGQMQASTTPVTLTTYSNEEYGFAFDYPEAWGHVVITDSKRTDNTFCGAGGVAFKYGGTWAMQDKQISFSHLPVDYNSHFGILSFDETNPIVWRCKEEGGSMDIGKEKQLVLDALQSGTSTQVLTNAQGVTIANWGLSYGAGSNVDQNYAIFHNGMRISGGLGFAPYYGTPESEEIQTFYNKCTELADTQPDCYPIREWAKQGVTAQTMREMFSQFDKVMQSFRFTK
jgi:hypothetical protein